MASYKLITTEDEKYISEFMDWLQENITPAQVDQETFANNIMNISNIMKFGSGGIDTSDEKAALPIDIVSGSVLSDKELEEHIWEEIELPLCETDRILKTDNYKKYLDVVKWAKFGRDYRTDR